MFTITINVPQDVLNAGEGSVQAAMYGQLMATYTPVSGPSEGMQLPEDQWVYYTGADYAAVTGPVPGFATYTTAGARQVNLPDVSIKAAHIIFGIGSLPMIPVDSKNAPQQPSPVTTASIYDFIEFTYDLTNTLYLNTTMIDQFGFPIQIQINPPDAILPKGAGVTLDREDVFNQYQAYVKDNYPDFLQCAQDPFGNFLTTRILSPKYALTGNCVQGVVANAFTGPNSTLAPGLHYYAVTALNSAGAESFAQYEVVHVVVPSSKPGTPCQAVSVAWAPNSAQPAGTAHYQVYRGTPLSPGSVTWELVGKLDASQFPVGVGGSFADTGPVLKDKTVKNIGNTSSHVDSGSSSKSQSPPVYFPASACWSAYDAFFHQPPISLNGAAYAGPYDDQGGQSSTISTASPTSVAITLGPWTAGAT